MRALLAPRPRGLDVVNRSPVPLVSRTASFLSRAVNRTDVVSQLSTYEQVSTLHAIVNRTTEAVASVCWNLYRVPRSGDVEGRRPVTRHPALDLLNRPNPFQTRMRFMRAAQQHAELAGEADLVVAKHPDLGIPVELWLARPDRMHPVPDPEEFMRGWVYTGPQGETVPLELDEVIQVMAGPNPLEPYRGLSPVPAAMIDLEASQLAAQWNLNFFHNSAVPGGVIEVPRELKDAEFDRMLLRWREAHKGVANAHRVAILENAKFVPQSYTMRDMEFVGLRGLSREIIREAFGFPLPMLGGVQDVNKAAAWAAQVIFARWLVKPRLETWRETLNTFLLPMYGTLGERLMFDFENPIPEDREDDDRERTSKSTAVSQVVAAGAYLPDALEAYGLPAMRRTVDVEAEADPEAEPDAGDPAEPTEPGTTPPAAPAEDDPAPDDVAAMLRSARRAAERTRSR